MVTTVIRTIGTGGDFANITAFGNAVPADLTLNVTAACGTGSTTTAIVLDAAASATTGAYVGNTLTIGSETLLITAYNTTTKTATVGAINSGGASAFGTAPAAGASYTIGQVLWQGQLLKQVHVPGQINNKTCSATCYVELTTAPGASFVDDVNFATTPLRYDGTKGAAIEGTSANGSYALSVNFAYFRLTKVLLNSTDTGTSALPTVLFNNVGTGLIDRCIIEGYGINSSSWGVLRLYGTSTISNSLVVQRRNDPAALIAYIPYGPKAINTAFVSTAVKLNVGLKTTGVAAQLTNCYVGNVTACEDGAIVATKTTCYSDSASSGYTTAAFSTANFASITDGSHDFRLAAGSALINVGTANAGGATSINGLSRPVGAAYDIGPWEYNSNVADTTAPVLSAPTAAATTATSATGSVATNEGGGTLYFLASSNAAPLADAVKLGQSQSVAATGAQNVIFAGLSANTSYYGHFLHRDAAGNDSAVASSVSFTTPAVDNTAPTFAGGAVITPGTITQTTVAFSYPLASDNVSVAGYETSRDAGATWQNNGTGTTGQFTGLNAGTTYQIAVRAYDAAGNRSAPITLSMTTTAAPTTGSFKTIKLANNSGTAWAAGTAIAWEWHKARIGTQGTITYGGGTIDTDLTLTATGLPVGAGYLIAAVQGATMADDKPYYQAGTVA